MFYIDIKDVDFRNFFQPLGKLLHEPELVTSLPCYKRAWFTSLLQEQKRAQNEPELIPEWSLNDTEIIEIYPGQIPEWPLYEPLMTL